MPTIFLSNSLAKHQRKLQVATVLVVVSAFCVLAYLTSRDTKSTKAAQNSNAPLSSAEMVAALGHGPGTTPKKINPALPSVETVATTPALAKELAQAVQNCRHSRIADSITGRPAGQDPFNGMGTTTTCQELFDRYGDRMDEALYHLKSSPDPVMRGYYYDANYDVLTDKALPLQGVLAQDSPARQAYERLTDAHFEDVARDIDHCSPDSVARMHLSQKLTSAKYANPAVSYFTSRVLMAHDPSDVKLRAYSDRVREDNNIDRQLAIQIEASVLRGTEAGCGVGALGKELAIWKGYGGGKTTEDPPDELDTSHVAPR